MKISGMDVSIHSLHLDNSSQHLMLSNQMFLETKEKSKKKGQIGYSPTCPFLIYNHIKNPYELFFSISFHHFHTIQSYFSICQGISQKYFYFQEVLISV